MRTEIESTEESHANAIAIITAMGLTEDEYWNEYKPKYESPAHLTKIRVERYLGENNLPQLDISLVDCQIIDQDYFDSL